MKSIFNDNIFNDTAIRQVAEEKRKGEDMGGIVNIIERIGD